METKILEQIGLTKGEALVYIALSELGETTTGSIVTRTNMQKSAVYFCLERLLSMGLVSYMVKNNKKHFSAAPPERLAELLEHRTNEIEKQKKKLQELMPELSAMVGGAEKRAGTRFFIGWNGMKTAFEDILKVLKKGDNYHVLGVYAVPKVVERFRRFIGSFQARRAETGIKLSIVVNEELRGTVGADRKKEKLTSVRFVPKNYASPAVINVYGNKTLIALWTEEPVALVVENKEMAESFRNYFKMIWGLAKD